MNRDEQKQNEDLAAQVLEHLKNPPVEVINPKDSGSHTKKYIVLALTTLIVLAVIGVALWKFVLSDNKTEQASQATPTATEEKPDNDAPNELSQEYSSEKMFIDISYPASWKLDESNGEILVYSPEIELENATGDKLTSEFRVIIKKGAGEPDSQYLGRGAAVNKSEPISYNDPTAGQRKKSYLTDFGLDSSAYFSYFVVQGNFELKKNETLGKTFASEADEILVSGGFYSQDSDDETKMVSLDKDTFSQHETYKTAVEIVKTLRLR